MAQVDERLKRRFSVSTSMEEISKIAEMKSIGSQQNIGNPEQAALAQSQHFDQLEALWNKRSPPRRRMNQVSLNILVFVCVRELDNINSFKFLPQSLSRQSSLAEDRINSSDEDEFLEERSGGTYLSIKLKSFAVRPNSFPQSKACRQDSFIDHSTSSLSLANNQPDLIKEVLANSMKTSRTENDIQRLQASPFQSTSFEANSSESFPSFRNKKSRNNRPTKSESFTKVNEESKIKKKRKKDFLSRSCITQ